MKLHTSIKDGFLYSASAVRLGVITVISFNIRKKSQIIKRMHTFTYYVNNTIYFVFLFGFHIILYIHSIRITFARVDSELTTTSRHSLSRVRDDIRESDIARAARAAQGEPMSECYTE